MMSRQHLVIAWVTLVVLGWLNPCASVFAEIASTHVDPATPTSQDSILFSVEGWFQDGCWAPQDFTFARETPTRFAAHVYALDSWHAGIICPMMIVPYTYSATFGPMAPGNYTISVTEHHQSLRDPWPNSTSLAFEVSPALSPVSDLVINVEGSNIVLVWSSADGAVGYKIYRSAVYDFQNGPNTLLDSTANPEYIDSEILNAPNERYSYCVTIIR